MKYNPSKPAVGQNVFSLNIGNDARNREQELTPMVITKVGRKYFTAQRPDDTIGYSGKQYHLDTWIEKTEFCANSRIFVTEQEWLDEQEINQINEEMKNLFSYRSTQPLSLAALHAIQKIIEDDKK